MTQLLEKVLTEVQKLPPEKQDAIAAVILEELEDAQLWEKAFSNLPALHFLTPNTHIPFSLYNPMHVFLPKTVSLTISNCFHSEIAQFF